MLVLARPGGASAEGWKAGTAGSRSPQASRSWMAGYGARDQALGRGGARPLGQGPGPRRPVGPEGRAGHARPLRDRPRPLDPDPRRDRSRATGWSATGSSWPARTPTAGRSSAQPDHHVPDRRRPAATGRASTPSSSRRRSSTSSAEAAGQLEPAAARLGDRPGRLRGQPPRTTRRPTSPPCASGWPCKGPVDHDVPVLRVARGRRQGPRRSSSATPATAPS